jgi:hypothetical protein
VIERKLRISLSWDSAQAEGWHLLRDRTSSPELMLNVVDFFVARHAGPNRQLDRLEEVLIESGSAYTVQCQTQPYGLVRRVDPTVEAAARSVMSREDAPGRLLTRAGLAPTVCIPTQAMATATPFVRQRLPPSLSSCLPTLVRRSGG